MPRKRFNTDEKAVIHAGTAVQVQVQNVTQWHDATLQEPAIIQTDQWGWQYVIAHVDRSRGTVRAGDRFDATPGHVRARR